METAVIKATSNQAKSISGFFLAAFALIVVMGTGLALGACVAAPEPATSSATATATAPLESRPLKRGVNLSRWWEAEHDRALDGADIRRLQAMGFDFVRLPLDPLALGWDGGEAADTAPPEDDLKALRRDLETLIEAGFTVILDLHPKDGFQRKLVGLPPGEARQKLETIWRKLHAAIDGLPPKRLLIEILNEPKFGADRWWKMQEELIASLRTIYTGHVFVASTSPDNGWWQFDDLKPYKDANVIYDSHFYEPMAFTHHQVEWAGDFDPRRAALPVPYPVDPTDAATRKTDDPAIRAYLRQGWNHEKLAKLVGKIAAWQTENKARLACLEFGVYRKHIDGQSRLGWLRDLREEMEKQGIPWAMWEYKGPFGMLPVDADHGDAPDDAMIDALGLEHGDGDKP